MRSPRALVAAAAAAWILGGGAAAWAHIQVQPTEVAPLDAVKFTIVVPGETAASTTKVELRLPPDLLPFAWQDPPGWKRRIVPADDPASLGTVIWTGRLAPDGFVEFSFLAGTPEAEGELVWKAVQTYDDGTVVRWVGGPGSEEPAAVTLVTASAPRQNAGGENDGAGGGTETEPTGTQAAETMERPAESPATGSAAPASSSAGDDWTARFLAFIAIAVGFAAIAFALARGPRD